MAHRMQIAIIGGSALVVIIITAIAAAVVAVRLPPDFLKKDQEKAGSGAWRIARNILGWVLIIAGLIMLALPGPGVAVIILGVALADFPGKQRLLRWLLSRGRILQTINALRRKFGRAPLEMDDQASPASGPPGSGQGSSSRTPAVTAGP